jgi:hypothetical protein
MEKALRETKKFKLPEKQMQARPGLEAVPL